jgi:hypothetical protein
METRTPHIPAGAMRFNRKHCLWLSRGQNLTIFPVRKNCPDFACRGVSPDPLYSSDTGLFMYAGNGSHFIIIALWRYSLEERFMPWKTEQEIMYFI